MHRFRAWGLAALAAGSAATAGFAADPAPRPADSQPWYGRLFGGKPDLLVRNQGTEPAPAKPAASPQPPAVAPLGPEALADALRAEQDAYLRRLDVCTKLRQVALETNDEKLIAQADGLEQQATALYHQRTARFGVRGGPKGSSTMPAGTMIAGRKAEDKLDEKLGSGTATDPLAAAKPAPETAKPATAQARTWKVVPE